MVKKQIVKKKCKVCGNRKDIHEFKKDSRTMDGYTFVCLNCIKSNKKPMQKKLKYDHYYLYRFLNEHDEILYIGKTTNIKNRMNSHLDNHFRMRTPEKFNLYTHLHKIEFCEVESDYHMNIFEIHYICKYKPKFNVEFNSINTNLFDLPELNWKLYILDSFISDVYLYYYINFKLKIKGIKEKLNNDIQFYNDFLKTYLDLNYVHRTFNSDLYEFDGNTGDYIFTGYYDEEYNNEEEQIIEY